MLSLAKRNALHASSKKSIAVHRRARACVHGQVLEVCCMQYATSDERVLPLLQITTFDIAEFNAMITDPSWIAAYGKAQVPETDYWTARKKVDEKYNNTDSEYDDVNSGISSA